jgi:hypothetical protein
MANNSVNKKQKSSTKINSQKDPVKKDFEKSVIKDMENSKLRIKPWVLKLIGGIFIFAGIAFILYPLFSNRVSVNLPDVFNRDDQEVSQDEDGEEDENNNDEDSDENNDEGDTDDGETAGDKENDADTEGNIAGGNSTRRDDSTTETAQVKSAQTIESINSTGRWRATDYVKGDINPGSYEIKLGDTLWEISEALYGDGSKWMTILENNSSSIGYLADGTQALIIPGQFLTLK